MSWCARFGQLADRVVVEAVALVNTVGDVVIHIRSEHLQEMPEDRNRRDAVHVIVAVDGYFFVVCDGPENPMHRRGQTRHPRRLD
jgi:hypothetical protein